MRNCDTFGCNKLKLACAPKWWTNLAEVWRMSKSKFCKRFIISINVIFPQCLPMVLPGQGRHSPCWAAPTSRASCSSLSWSFTTRSPALSQRSCATWLFPTLRWVHSKVINTELCSWLVDNKTTDSQSWGPRFKSAGSGSSAFGQGTLSSLPSPSERT